MVSKKSIFPVLSAVILALIVLLSAYVFDESFSGNAVYGADKEAAKEALSLMKEWVVWMASIQTATITALGLLAKDGVHTFTLSPFQKNLAILIAIFNTYALFISAWLLTSLSSLMLRIYQEGLCNYDFYTMPIYEFMKCSPFLKVFSVGYFAFWNHWLWGIGMLLFGLLAISMLVNKSVSSPSLQTNPPK